MGNHKENFIVDFIFFDSLLYFKIQNIYLTKTQLNIMIHLPQDHCIKHNNLKKGKCDTKYKKKNIDYKKKKRTRKRKRINEKLFFRYI